MYDDPTQVIRFFGLTKSQLRILFSLEALMVRNDAMEKERILNRINPFAGKHDKKKQWLERFIKETENYLKGTEPFFEDEMLYPLQYPNTLWMLKNEISNLSRKNDDTSWKYKIFMECALFIPYYPLSEEDATAKTYKNLAWDEDKRKVSLKVVAEILGVDPKLADKYKKTFKDAIGEMEGKLKKILLTGLIVAVIGGLLVIPFIGPIAAAIAPTGLYGAAAISSGLAALGGGALAAGGFGIMGGIAVIIGGGFILGGGVGTSLAIAVSDPKAIMFAGGKIAVVVKDILIGQFNNRDLAFKVLEQVKEQESNLQKLLLRIEKENIIADSNIDPKKQKKNLKESIEMLSKLIDFLKKILGISK